MRRKAEIILYFFALLAITQVQDNILGSSIKKKSIRNIPFGNSGIFNNLNGISQYALKNVVKVALNVWS